MVSKRLSVILAVGIALALPACGGGGGTVLSGTAEPEDRGVPRTCSTSMDATEMSIALDVLEIVNIERAARGLPSLQWDCPVSEVAYAHSLDMDVRSYFAHTNPDGQGPAARLNANGVGYSAAGENIYRRSPSGSAVHAMHAWMGSAGHRANILSSAYSHLGVGVHRTESGTWFTQVFIRP